MSQSTASGQGPGLQPSITTNHVRPRDDSNSSLDILTPTASPNENNSSGGDGDTIAGLNKDTCTSSVKPSKMESHPNRSPVMAGRYRIPTVSSSSSHRTHSGQSTHSGQDASHRSSFPLPLAPPKPASLPTPTLPGQTAHKSVRISSSSSSNNNNNNNAHAGLRYSMDYDQGYTSGIKYTKRAQGDNSFHTNGGKNGSHSRAQQAMDDIKTEAFAAGKLHGYQTGYQTGCQEGRREAYHEGHLVGHREGHRDGRDDGLREGRREAQKDSQRHGYNEGHRVGEEKGYAEGQKKGYAEGHEAGRSEGRESGHGEGYHAGFDEGYDQGYYDGHGHGEQRGHARGWDEGYEQGFAWASTFWTSGPLKADAQEFVPKTYTGPLVVDGLSGPGVDPTLFRSWLNDVEHRQLTRPAQADVASDQDTVQQPDTRETDQRGGIDHLVTQTDDLSAKEKREEHHIGQPITIDVGLSVDDEAEDSDPPIDSGNRQHDKKTATVEVDDSGDDVFVTPYESPVAARVGILGQESDNESEADLCAGGPAASPPRREAPRPRVASPSPSRTVSPASFASGATVAHNGTQEGDTVTHYITFGDVLVTITKSPAGTVAVPSWPPTTVDVTATIGATAAEVDDADASDMDSLGGQSTLVLDISDEEMPEPAERLEVQVDVDDASIRSPTLSETEVDHSDTKGKAASATSKATAQAAPQIQMPPNPVMTFEDIAIFESQGPNPPLPRYPSPLDRTPPLFEIGPDQAPQVTESYPSFRRRGCNTVFSAYRLEPGQIFDPLAEVDDKKGTIFAVGGRTPPRGMVKLVPDHIVYKFGIPPSDHSNETNDANDTNDTHAAASSGAERLARCLQHGLSTCPMCAITPSFRFLGPGEALAAPLAHDGTPAGDPQTSQAAFAFGPFRPAGFGDVQVHGRPLQESSLAAAQHPDEASPPCPVRMMPQYDPEVLGHQVRDERGERGERNEHGEHAREKPVPPSALNTHYCDPCGGLTWLVTRRSRPHGGGPPAVGTNSTNADNGGNGYESSGGRTMGDRTFGRSHPSHHASFNEPWSRSRSFCASLGGRGSSRFPEQAGTTRSLFVEVASVPAEATHKGQGRGRGGPARYGVAAFFGPNSRYNSRLDLDLATASTQVARQVRQDRQDQKDCRERLVDLPFERFSTNAGPLAAMAVALHRLWVDVVPAHRAAIDRVTRYNSDHSRRKAYRFRAIVMTDSAYVVDLFSDHLHKRWTRRFRPYDYVAPGSGNALAVSSAAAVADKPASKKKKKSGKRKSKKTKKAKKGKKEAEAKAEGAEEVHKKDKKEENKDEKAAVAVVGAVDAVGASSGKGIRTTVVMGAPGDSEPSDGSVATNNDNTRVVATFDELIDMDLAAAASPTFSIPTTTPTSSRADSHSRSQSPPPTRTTTLLAPAAESANGPDRPDRPNGPGPGPGPAPAPGVGLGLHVDGLFLPPASDRAHDAFAFDRPDGRFVYVSAHGGPPMANGYLVQLVRRYMEMLRQHGVQVALYEVEGPYVQNARRLAEEAIA
ncbi:uncharacterized protein SPSK_02148 [Sporothrix schenckii 1099-18]|uniref:Uncharacterized protein n=1 Tax=Sporothrix schenckii 1099-18 TaxID=1397361 RepID=A0A0F2M9D5_SPOSC|nr:uncharacterized protein SPSK_02148 [Sporothrix schenckii 1099-18]KJR86318.1 hypothetical protein SPSK_02148 [Sporothrix schenckii 1099-18]